MDLSRKPYSPLVIYVALFSSTGLCLWVLDYASPIKILDVFVDMGSKDISLSAVLLVMLDYALKIFSAIAIINIIVCMTASALVESYPEFFNEVSQKSNTLLQSVFKILVSGAIYSPVSNSKLNSKEFVPTVIIVVLQVVALTILIIAPLPLGTINLMSKIHHLLLGGTMEQSLITIYSNPLGPVLAEMVTVIVYISLYATIKEETNDATNKVLVCLMPHVRSEKHLKELAESKVVILIKTLLVLLSVTILVLSLI